MSTEQLLIHELAERAQTTIRTIRYYTDEGLLPQPIIQGKYAVYTQGHVNRLELIHRMKDAYLPLREIRQIMLSLSDDEVQQRLNEQAQSLLNAPAPSPTKNPAGPGSEALEYISRLIKEQGEYQPNRAARPPQSPLPRQVSEPAPTANYPASAAEVDSAGETWQRIRMADGVELHLRTPANSETNQRIQQIIAFSKKIFRQN